MLRIREKLQSSWLIQRLKAPEKSAIPGMVFNPFSFGGGLSNGGLSPQAAVILSTVCSFDYMGAAEFEFGAVPKAFKFIAENKPTHHLLTSFGNNIYLIMPEAMKDMVIDRVVDIATNEGFRSKEYVGLREQLIGRNGKMYLGWLELDNGFMFFTDEKMFIAFKDLFNIK